RLRHQFANGCVGVDLGAVALSADVFEGNTIIRSQEPKRLDADAVVAVLASERTDLVRPCRGAEDKGTGHAHQDGAGDRCKQRPSNRSAMSARSPSADRETSSTHATRILPDRGPGTWLLGRPCHHPLWSK